MYFDLTNKYTLLEKKNKKNSEKKTEKHQKLCLECCRKIKKTKPKQQFLNTLNIITKNNKICHLRLLPPNGGNGKILMTSTSGGRSVIRSDSDRVFQIFEYFGIEV